MSNSNLVTHVNLSPNCNSPRNNEIKKITIHHQAGFQSVEELGKSFARESRGASSNYGIDSEGHVGLYVEECDRSWCSSSPGNDNQAITIEVANDGAEPDWHVSDTAFAKLIELCIDICLRNDITALNFTGDYTGNLTMHQYFAPTACPGPYLASKFPYIAAEVNRALDIAHGNPIVVDPVVWPEPLVPATDITEIAAAVIRGDYGNGQERFDKLTAEGYDVDAIQTIVNEYYNGDSVEKTETEVEAPVEPTPEPEESEPEQDLTEVVNAVLRGDYGNGQERFDRLTAEGYNPEEVQNRVNEFYNPEEQSPDPEITDELVDAVIRGDYGNGQERTDRLTAEGYNPEEVQNRVNARFQEIQNGK